MANISKQAAPSAECRVAHQAAGRCALDQLRAGGVAVVRSVAGDDACSQRLHAMGIWAGTQIERLATAPFGGPIMFRLHGYRLALRRSEAARVCVSECPA